MDEKEYNDWENFGTRVKNARKSIGMTAEKLAEKTNRTENFILRIENGKKKCSINTLYQICKVLNVSADELLLGKDERNKDYEDIDIIDNILKKCDERQLKAVKEVLIAIFNNFDNFGE